FVEVDLSSSKVRVIDVSEELYKKFLGGRGLGSWLLWERLGRRWDEVDPLSPENLLIILTGPMTGYIAGVRLAVTGKSPQSGGTVGSTIASEVGLELKTSGYDGLIISGRAKDPVYLFINDDRIEVRDASKIWGKGIRETHKLLLRDVMPELRKVPMYGEPKEPAMIYIGPAGENLVKMSAVEGKYAHAAAYGSYGAVMGSKNLKAVVVKGSGPLPPVYDISKLKELIYRAIELVPKKVPRLRIWGTGQGPWRYGRDLSSIPVRNWQEEYWEKDTYSQYDLEVYDWVKRYWADYGCSLCCMKVTVLHRNGETVITDAPDYELLAYEGSNLGIYDVRDIAYLIWCGEELGFDMINAGNVLGFVAELFEKGILTKEDIGFEVRWGDVKAFAHLLKLIANKEGIGRILAEGIYRAALKIAEMKGLKPEDVLKYAVQAKGIAIGAHGIRSGLDYPILSYVTSVQGGDHQSVAMLPLDAAPIVNEVWASFADSAVICQFNVLGGLDFVFEALRSITGWNITKEVWVNEHAKRILTLQRTLLLLGGPDIFWDPRIHDDNPPRFYEPLPSGPKKGQAPTKSDVAKMRSEYYKALGWDEYGIPTEETVRQLGLTGTEEALKKIRKRLNLP
ncbi:MAG: aldehyde ferredoxin oxidoreductase C-terminal domain-containing protein, partial [Sulfolobales archaeon]